VQGPVERVFINNPIRQSLGSSSVVLRQITVQESPIFLMDANAAFAYNVLKIYGMESQQQAARKPIMVQNVSLPEAAVSALIMK